MICPTCGQHRQRVLETRQSSGMTRRRHECIDGHRWNTYELPETALRSIGMPRLRAELSRLERGIIARQKSTSRRELVAHMLAQGQPSSVIAREAGCTDARVRQIRAALAQCQDGQEPRNPHRAEPRLAGGGRQA